ncbi:putative Protein of unknown function (DUF773) [Trypanosoma vivax]|nr:hypothetical protein TRVL_07009 [Trypanosoma vivax]KAH8613623.1 putative Protein of unknown function (DUF773) [Trypanosoma vivax]
MEQQPIPLHYQRMEEWLLDRRTVLEKKHKKSYARLLELAPQLVQLVHYDIPAQQRHLKKVSSAVDDTQKAIEDAKKTTQNFEERWVKMVENYGLQRRGSVDVDCDLEVAVDARIADGTVLLNEAIRKFGANANLALFREVYANTLTKHSGGMYSAEAFSQHFPWLERVFQERSCVVENKTASVVLGDGEHGAGACCIDWGDVDASEPVDLAAAVDIKWTGCDADELVAGGAQWDEEDPLPEARTGVFTIDISNATHRRHVLTELDALQCFVSELLTVGDVSLVECSECAQALKKQLTESIESVFVRMKGSATARHSLIDEIHRLKRAATQAAVRRSGNEGRLQQLLEELARVEPELNTMVSNARTCRDECLVELKKMFPEREVAIVGDINKYL